MRTDRSGWATASLVLSMFPPTGCIQMRIYAILKKKRCIYTLGAGGLYWPVGRYEPIQPAVHIGFVQIHCLIRINSYRDQFEF
jgi:hypothetical protein